MLRGEQSLLIPEHGEWRAQSQPRLWGTPVGRARKAFPGYLLPADDDVCEYSSRTCGRAAAFGAEVERGGSSRHEIKGEVSGKGQSRAGLAAILVLRPRAVFYGSPKLQVSEPPRARSKLAAPVRIRGLKLAAAFQRGGALCLQKQLLIQGKARVESGLRVTERPGLGLDWVLPLQLIWVLSLLRARP